jgi:pimeloyl-ACP methyl ester carboxylesterase
MIVDTKILGRDLRYRRLTAVTPDGVAIAVQDHDRGRGARDILLIHGYSQSSLAWLRQVTGPLADEHRLVTYDLRGHGMSDKPADPIFYRDPSRWADEVQAVIDATGMHEPILICWSYGGRVALDFLTEKSAAAIGGLVMVAATSTDRAETVGPATPLLRRMAAAEELAENIVATADLLAGCAAIPLSPPELGVMLAYNLMTPPVVRRALSGRPATYDDTLSRLTIPVLTVHGCLDQINLPTMSHHTARQVSHAQSLLYQESAHMPFWEEAERFDKDISTFVSALGAPNITPMPQAIRK